MTALTAHPPLAQRSLLDAPEEAPVREARRATLDDLVASTWHVLQVTHASSCMVCGLELAPRFGAGPHPVAAACRSCGSELS